MFKAKWIWINKEDNADEYGEFFDTFKVGEFGARINISCDSKYALYLNGKLVAFGQYDDFPWHKVYDSVDLTPFCVKGENSLHIIVWYIGHHYFTYYKGSPALAYEITDKTGEILAYSGGHVNCKLSENYVNYMKKEITNQILGYSFRYDLRKKSGKPMPSVEVGGICEGLNERPVKMLELTETFNAKLIDGQKKIYDLGCERVGFLHIKLKAKEGELITIAYGEHLTDGGVRRYINTYPLREGIGPRDYSVEIIADGKFSEYLNPFRRLGGRYLQILSDAEVEIEFIGIKEVHYPVRIYPVKPDTPLRERIYSTCIRTLRLCMHEHYEDCPWREQVLYALDSRNQMLCGYYVFKEFNYARASLRLLGNAPAYRGFIASSAPNNTTAEGSLPSFSLWFNLQMKEYIEHSGDCSLAEELYEKMSANIDVFVSHMKNGLIPNFPNNAAIFNFYEWSDDMENELFKPDEEKFDVQLNCILVIALESFEYICKKLDRPFNYPGLAEKLKKRIDEFFYDENTRLYHNRNELANALTVLCGAATGERAKHVCEVITSENNGLASTTLSTLGFKYDALYKFDIKYKDYILDNIDKLYGFMLERGATSFWETIKGENDFCLAGSLCHGWSAMPVYYYHKFFMEEK